MNTAALYLRSSKDRSDVSIDAQRRELQALAQQKGLLIIKEFADVVESAKDVNRPGFQRLLLELKSPLRAWDHLLMVDTSRLSRRRYAAQVFKHEAQKRNITILFSKVPETDPITSVILQSVFEAMDEVHSLMSREKGLAGMAENIRAGYRAGGRAPLGYLLKKIETGAMREGTAVAKSLLTPDPDHASTIARYLKMRATGINGAAAARQLGITWPRTTLIGIEWNSLTYAGHNVWNVNNERLDDGGYKDGHKRRPREEWIIQKNTHPALITDEEAEQVLKNLNENPWQKGGHASSDYLLTGLLKTPDGLPWYGDRKVNYRTKPTDGSKSRWLKTADVDRFVLKQVSDDLQNNDFINQLFAKARSHLSTQTNDPTNELQQQVQSINEKINRMIELAAEMDNPSPVLRKIEGLEKTRLSTEEQLITLQRQQQVQAAINQYSRQDIHELIKSLSDQFANMPQEAARSFLQSLISKIALNPITGECQIHYRLCVQDRNNVASPRGADSVPVLTAISCFLIAA